MSPHLTRLFLAVATTTASIRLTAANDTFTLNELLACDTAPCTTNATFILPPAEDIVAAVLTLRVSGNLGSSSQSMSVDVNGIAFGSCGEFGPDCTSTWQPCLDPINVIDVDDQSGDAIVLTIETTSSVDTLCNTTELQGASSLPFEATVVVEATLYVTTALVTLSPTSSCIQTRADSPFEPIANTGEKLSISRFDDDFETILLPFAFPWLTDAAVREITVTTNGQINIDDNEESCCLEAVPLTPAFVTVDVAERIAIAQSDLDPSSSRDAIWYLIKPASVIISFEGVRFWSSENDESPYYGNDDDITYYDDDITYYDDDIPYYDDDEDDAEDDAEEDDPTGPGFINAQVELYADGAIELRFGKGYMDGVTMASGVQSQSQGIYLPADSIANYTDGVTASWPENEGVRFVCASSVTAPPSISLPPTVAPTAAPTLPEVSTRTVTLSARCSETGCTSSVTFVVPLPPSDDAVLSLALLNVSIGGDLGDSGETLSIFIGSEEAPRATCGELMRDDCNGPDVPCLVNVDVTQLAQSGVFEVSFTASELVNGFCYLNAVTNVAAVIEATLVLFYNRLSVAAPTPLNITSNTTAS